jgi:hypothetical protein
MDPNIRVNLKLIQDKLNELRRNGMNDSFELEMYFINHMTDLYDAYPYLIKRLCREENQDNSFLYKMIDNLEQVRDGNKSMKEAQMELGEELAEKYVYPVISKEELLARAMKQEKEKKD